MTAITEINAQDVIKAIDLRSMPLDALADLCAQVKNVLQQVQRREACFRFKVKGTWVEFSDFTGSFRFPDKMQRAKLMADVLEDVLHIEKARVRRTGMAVENFCRHLDSVAYYAEALAVAFDRIELRVIKGELTAA